MLFSQIAFPKRVLPKDDRTDSVQEERLGLPYWTIDFGHLCCGRRIQLSGHSDFGIFNNLEASSIFTWVQADTAFAACPSQAGNLEMISMILAATKLCFLFLQYGHDDAGVDSPVRILVDSLASRIHASFV